LHSERGWFAGEENKEETRSVCSAGNLALFLINDKRSIFLYIQKNGKAGRGALAKLEVGSLSYPILSEGKERKGSGSGHLRGILVSKKKEGYTS
jgi:hypothetical protein